MASGPITSWQIDGETVETVSDYFGEWTNIKSMARMLSEQVTVLRVWQKVKNSRAS